VFPGLLIDDQVAVIEQVIQYLLIVERAVGGQVDAG
jgi:hypothetical protein